MVHRHEQPRRGRVCHRDRLLGRAVVANPGVVRADWHDGGLVWSMAPMAMEGGRGGGVAGDEQPAPFTFDNESGVPAPCVAAKPSPPVLHLDRTHDRVPMPS